MRAQQNYTAISFQTTAFTQTLYSFAMVERLPLVIYNNLVKYYFQYRKIKLKIFFTFLTLLLSKNGNGRFRNPYKPTKLFTTQN